MSHKSEKCFREFYDTLHESSGDSYRANYSFTADVEYNTNIQNFDRVLKKILMEITFNNGQNKSVFFLGKEIDAKEYHTEFNPEYQEFFYNESENELTISGNAQDKSFNTYTVIIKNIQIT
jgi:hypothetical protein